MYLLTECMFGRRCCHLDESKEMSLGETQGFIVGRMVTHIYAADLSCAVHDYYRVDKDRPSLCGHWGNLSRT